MRPHQTTREKRKIKILHRHRNGRHAFERGPTITTMSPKRLRAHWIGPSSTPSTPYRDMPNTPPQEHDRASTNQGVPPPSQLVLPLLCGSSPVVWWVTPHVPSPTPEVHMIISVLGVLVQCCGCLVWGVGGWFMPWSSACLWPRLPLI
jgi:hypothetical protein